LEIVKKAKDDGMLTDKQFFANGGFFAALRLCVKNYPCKVLKAE
jgi:hypothetical protein